MKSKVNGKRRLLRVIINLLITGDTVVLKCSLPTTKGKLAKKSCCSVGFDLLSVDGMSIIVFLCSDSDKLSY